MIWSEYVIRKGTSVPVANLSENSNMKVECSCDACHLEFLATYQSLIRQGEYHLCISCTRQLRHRGMKTSKISEANSKRSGSRHPRWKEDKPEYVAYASVVRKLTEMVYKEHSGTINPLQFKRTRCGVEGGYQLDHKRSIRVCFEEGISVEECSHISNLQMLPWQTNRQKSNKE